jgi:hypothetical protein
VTVTVNPLRALARGQMTLRRRVRQCSQMTPERLPTQERRDDRDNCKKQHQDQCELRRLKVAPHPGPLSSADGHPITNGSWLGPFENVP